MHIRQAFRYLPALAFFSLLAIQAPAQTSTAASRIVQPIDSTKLTTLNGNTHPLARAKFDRGAVSTNFAMDRMLLVLKRSPEREVALQAFMHQQITKGSPNYHKWLTPKQFGEQYGPSDEDISKVTAWLQSNGFNVARVSSGKTVVEFSGNADSVQRAFHTSIHHFAVNGDDRFSNSSDPKIPTALTPVVAGVSSFNNFPKKAMHHVNGLFTRKKETGEISRLNANFTYPCTQSDCSYTNYTVGPYDFATIYNVTPLWNAGIDGTGQTIAIVADSNINPADVTNFRAAFGLPVKAPVIVVNGADPGVLPNGNETEAVLDTEWSGAVAKNATINLVVTADTATPGVDLSAEYIIENQTANILSYSYGECELGDGTAENVFYNNMWQQAAADGITVLISAGDSGSAGCDISDPTDTDPQAAQYGLAVTGESTTPYNVAVGGTDFGEYNKWTTYWNASNNANLASAKGYIPEVSWNDSCTNALYTMETGTTDQATNCNNLTISPTFIITDGGGGGVSNCTTSNGQVQSTCSGGYSKPDWQAGPGVPADGKRDVPDVSFFGGDGVEGSYYIVCEQDLNSGGNPCNLNSPYEDFIGVGGTSVSVQVFAGIVALLDQKAATLPNGTAAQGLINPELYALASDQTTANCNTASPASTCVFHDVTTGTISQPCLANSPNCTVVGTNTYGILSGFDAGVGYDLATGLGSINAANLVNAWTISPDFTLFANPASLSIASGSAGTFVLTVGAVNGFSGTVNFTSSACSGLPAMATCTFSSPSVTGAGTTTVTITTTGSSKMMPAGKPTSFHGPANTKLLFTFALTVTLLLVFYQARRPRWSATATLLMCFSLAILAGCGGGGGSNSSGSTTNPGTPTTNDQTVTITGTSGSLTHTTTVSLTVQ